MPSQIDLYYIYIFYSILISFACYVVNVVDNVLMNTNKNGLSIKIMNEEKKILLNTQ